MQWAIEKFVNPERTVRIHDHVYYYDLEVDWVPVIGGLEVVLALALLAGLLRRITYGIAFAIHGISVVATWRLILDPYNLDTHNHLFMTGVPVLAAFWLLYMLRELDTFSAEAMIRQRNRRPAWGGNSGDDQRESEI